MNKKEGALGKREVSAEEYEAKILEMWEAWQVLREISVEQWHTKGRQWVSKLTVRPPVVKFNRTEGRYYDYSKCFDLQWLTEQVGKIRGKYVEKMEIEHTGDAASDILRERERLGIPSKVLGKPMSG